MGQKIIKTDAVNGNVEDADVVICYGNINGSVKKCQYVVLIDGAINGHIINCENVRGFLTQGDKRENATN